MKEMRRVYQTPELYEMDGCYLEPQGIFYLRDTSIFTERTLQVLKLIMQGYSYKKIGQELAISPRTAGNHFFHREKTHKGIVRRLQEYGGSDRAIFRRDLLKEFVDLELLLINGAALSQAVDAMKNKIDFLSPRQRQVVLYALQGCTIEETVGKLDISLSSVKNHRSNAPVETANLFGSFLTLVANTGRIPEGFESVVLGGYGLRSEGSW